MTTKQPVRRPGIFAGQEQHSALMEVVGRIVTNFGTTEDSLRYLHWQLQAFELAEPMAKSGLPDNDLQKALAPHRTTYFGKHMVLFRILEGIDKAFAAPAVKVALGPDEPAIVGRWNALNTTAKVLGNRRNDRAHSAVALLGNSPVRAAGLLEAPKPFKPEDDEQLIADISAFSQELGEFINELTGRLPFRDFNQVHFSYVKATLVP
jgi:hypothetical protein